MKDAQKERPPLEIRTSHMNMQSHIASMKRMVAFIGPVLGYHVRLGESYTLDLTPYTSVFLAVYPHI